MAGVKKVTNMAAKDVAAMSTEFLEMSTRIPMAATGLADIAAAAGAAGVGMTESGKAMKDQRAQLLAFTEDAAKMGVAFDMTAEDAGGTMAKWRAAFKMTQPQVRALGDQVNELTNTFGGKASDVADIVTRIGPLGKVAGLAAPQIAALGSTLNSVGVENEIAATGIKNMMLALTKGSAATKSQSAAFKALGLDSVQVAKDMQKNASGTIVNVMERIGKLSPDKQASMLSEMFGSESVGAISPMLTSLDRVKSALNLVGDRAKYAGSMNNEFLTRIGTTKGVTGLALNSLQALNVELGQKLLPYVVQGANWIRATTNSIRGWAKANPAWAAGIMKVAGALAFLLIGFGGIAIGAGTLMKAWSVIRLGAVLMGGPLKILPTLFKALPVVFGIVRTAAMFMARGIMQAGIMMLANPLVLAIVAIGVAIGVLGYLVYQNWDKIKAAFATGMAALGNAWTAIKGFFSSGIAAVGGIFSGFGGVISRAWGAIKGAFNTGVAALAGLVPSFKNIGSMMLEGLLSMLSPTRLARHLWNMGKTAIGAFKNVLGIKSPSRVFAELGGHVAGGLAVGIDRGSRHPVQRTRRLAGELSAAMAASALTVGVTPMAEAMTSNAGVRVSSGSAMPASVVAKAGGAAGAGRARGRGGAGMVQHVNVTIQLVQQPGQNASDMAREVKRLIDQEAASARRGMYGDQDDF